MQRNRLGAFIAVTLVAVAGSSVRADLVPIGDPFDGNSWGHEFQETSGSYDLIAVRMFSSGDSFESPTFSNFSVLGWHLAHEGRKHTVGTAVYGADGECRALARAIWIEVPV